MLDAAKKCMPIKDITIRSNDSPWVTDKIIELKEKKKKIHQAAKRFNTPTDWERFRRIRNDYTDAIRKRKIEYLTQLDNEASLSENIGTKNGGNWLIRLLEIKA